MLMLSSSAVNKIKGFKVAMGGTPNHAAWKRNRAPMRPFVRNGVTD